MSNGPHGPNRNYHDLFFLGNERTMSKISGICDKILIFIRKVLVTIKHLKPIHFRGLFPGVALDSYKLFTGFVENEVEIATLHSSAFTGHGEKISTTRRMPRVSLSHQWDSEWKISEHLIIYGDWEVYLTTTMQSFCTVCKFIVD